MTADLSAPYPSVEGSECPWPEMERMREAARAYQLESQPDLYVVSDYEDVRYVTTTLDIFSNYLIYSGFNGGVDVMIGSSTLVPGEVDGEDHKRKRAIALAAVKPNILKSTEPWIRELADSLIENFAADGPVDFAENFASKFASWVGARLCGLPDADIGWIVQWGRMEVHGMRFMPDSQREIQASQGAEMFNYLTEKILEIKDNPGDNAITRIIEAQMLKDGDFNIDEVRVATMAVLLGGLNSVSHTMTTAMYYLLSDRALLERVRADYTLIPRVIEETVRIEPATVWLPRKVVVDTTLGESQIPAGSFALINFAGANRTKSTFPDPEKFDIDRENLATHLGFGFGKHLCLGAPLARIEMRLAFEQLFTRLKNIEFAPGNDFSHVPSPAFRGLQHLFVNVESGTSGPAVTAEAGAASTV